jgi:5S rRNA maturation endonuclease (ribonuclease M5)
LRAAESIAVLEIASRLGLQVRQNNSLAPCPSCNAMKRGSSDKRGPIGVRSDNKGWKCHRCQSVGSGIDLVSYALNGSKFSESDNFGKKKVEAWFNIDQDAPPKRHKAPEPIRGKRPPKKEVHSLWSASKKLNQLAQSDQALLFLKSRNLNLEAVSKSGVVRISPDRMEYSWPDWWPAGRSALWRLIVPAFNVKGEFVSLHTRAVDVPKAGPKTLWPKGFEAKGLFMPNRYAVKMIRKEDIDLDGLLIVEGITDFIKCSAEVEDLGIKLAVLGGTSGSFSSVSQLHIPKDLKIYIGTDPDEKGEEYAQTIRLQLNGRVTYRIPFNEFGGSSDA